jgi:hypothetical protein
LLALPVVSLSLLTAVAVPAPLLLRTLVLLGTAVLLGTEVFLRTPLTEW